MIDKFGNELKENDIVAIGNSYCIYLALIVRIVPSNSTFLPIIVYVENDLTPILDNLTGTTTEFIVGNYKECMMKLPNCIRKNNNGVTY